MPGMKPAAEQLAEAYPDLIAVAHGATHRGQQVTNDHAQNSMSRNTAAVYALRARPSAPVSTPLTWDEVEAGKTRPDDWTVSTLPHRVVQMGDRFAPVVQGGQSLPRSRNVARAVGVRMRR